MPAVAEPGGGVVSDISGVEYSIPRSASAAARTVGENAYIDRDLEHREELLGRGLSPLALPGTTATFARTPRRPSSQNRFREMNITVDGAGNLQVDLQMDGNNLGWKKRQFPGAGDGQVVFRATKHVSDAFLAELDEIMSSSANDKEVLTRSAALFAKIGCSKGIEIRNMLISKTGFLALGDHPAAKFENVYLKGINADALGLENAQLENVVFESSEAAALDLTHARLKGNIVLRNNDIPGIIFHDTELDRSVRMENLCLVGQDLAGVTGGFKDLLLNGSLDELTKAVKGCLWDDGTRFSLDPAENAKIIERLELISEPVTDGPAEFTNARVVGAIQGSAAAASLTVGNNEYQLLRMKDGKGLLVEPARASGQQKIRLRPSRHGGGGGGRSYERDSEEALRRVARLVRRSNRAA